MPIATMLSPGVAVREYDLTQIVPQSAAHNAALVGGFAWGPANEIKTISDQQEMFDTFGKPGTANYLDWYSGKNFLDYSRNLKCVRVVASATALNSVDSGTGELILNEEDWVTNFSGMDHATAEVAGKWAGVYGNNLKVEFCDSGYYDSWTYKSQFLHAPGTSPAAERAGLSSADDEFHIVVIDTTGVITGIAGRVLERFSFVSKAADGRYEDGTSSYYVDVLRDQSRWIWPMAHYATTNSTTGMTYAECLADAVALGVFDQFEDTGVPTAVSYTLQGGVEGAPALTDYTAGWNLFKNKDEVDVGLLIGGGSTTSATTGSGMTDTDRYTLYDHILDNIAEYRKDCVAFFSPKMDDVVNNVGSEVTDSLVSKNLLNSSSYGFFDSGWKYQFDEYNNTYRWMPLNPDIAGLAAQTDEDRDPWWSIAGLNRGHIKNVVKLAWNPDQTDRDELYQSGVNSVITMAGEGTVLYGDKTMLSRPSAFDRINVRRLFIVLEKSVATAAKYQLFEFNDAFTRLRFRQMVEPFLRDVQGRRGIIDFKVVCDETNNTDYVIDSNSFVGDIYIKPNRSINFITLNFIATGTGVTFDIAQTMFSDVTAI